MIRRAKISEIDDILEITRACGQFMAQKGIHQWNEHYPSRNAFEKDVLRNELFVKEIDGQIIGGIVVSDFMDDEYIPIKWLTESNKNVYIHRLFINPRHQGQGHAQTLMDHAEAYARKNGYVSVRLDTFSQNKRNQRFYEIRGYQKLGNVFFPKQSVHPFHCYELVL